LPPVADCPSLAYTQDNRYFQTSKQFGYAAISH